MNEALKFMSKAALSLFAIGFGVKLGKDAIEHQKRIKIKNTKD